MATPSVSFRISRSAEDLAETIHALSHRLVTLEQRLEAMELGLAHQEEADDPVDLASLDNVERLLQDCRDLLGTPDAPDRHGHGAPAEERPATQGYEAGTAGEGFAAAA